MVKVSPTNAYQGFVSPVFFDRTEQLRERIVDCTREELIDLSFHYLSILEGIQGATEKVNRELEENLGYYDEWKKS